MMRDALPVAPRRPVDPATRTLRIVCIAVSILCGLGAAAVLAQASATDGLSSWDYLRVVLILITTTWLAWGAVMAFVGLPPRQHPRPRPDLKLPHAPTALLLPICNEDPVAVFARIAAMDRSIRAAGLTIDIAVLSDTRDPRAQALEQTVFARLLEETDGAGRIFYRNRRDNHGRKAGNIENFIRQSGAAYEFGIILDADSLMEGETLRGLIARMTADPGLGLLQTLPRVIGASTLFGRAMQFASSFHSPVFTRALARLQGTTGPFWGHNAIVRMRAFAECCGLPELQGPPPLGGTILSHDYVEAALLARGGWRVEVDEGFDGSFEEGPDNVTAHARRDRRWCQGNLQHMRVIGAPGLPAWSRFVLFQGITSYLVSLLWAMFLTVSVVATITAPLPDYFPDAYQLFPVFPNDRTREIIALAIGIGGLLIVPKFAILIEAAMVGRIRGFGGTLRAGLSVLTEIVLSSLMAPLMLMYQTRAVIEVLSGRDGGWPANLRGEGRLTLVESWRAGRWIATWGAILLAATFRFSPELVIWLLPVGLPMLIAPLIIAWSSRQIGSWLFLVPDETNPAPVVRDFRAQLDRWTAPARPGGSDKDSGSDAAPRVAA
ncbi:glucans biosynthesis glucosyltransferase MdoH [Tropicimonas sp. IMCC34043]|uniref:glucans biosynthesis glucosyltransferase MdoH n=1 Tax=Tropicimonas sp. IMCC34043 TaxID=2248760 RepID=UPI000E280BB1|nr:glucans biosynthesis glucosyltransferase MdoH [Tropicimonas sp. IMCC34043]